MPAHDAAPSRYGAPVRLDVAIAAALCIAIAGALAIESGRERTLQQANDAGLVGDFTSAARLASEAGSGPTRARALHVEGLALLAAARTPDAVTTLRAATEASPRNWRVRRDWAVALLRSGNQRAARVQISRAYALNPLLTPPDGFGGS